MKTVMKKAVVLSFLLAVPLLTAPVLAIPAQAHAGVRADLGSTDLIATLDGKPVPAHAVDLLLHEAQRAEPDITREAVTARLIENRLLGNYALKTYGDDVLFDNQRVGFQKKIELENQLVATFQAMFKQPLQKALAGPRGPAGAVVHTYTPTAEALTGVFGSTDKILLDYNLNAAQQEEARKVPLLGYKLAGAAEKTISLFDIYEYQNVQGRVMLFGRDTHYMNQQALQLLEHRFVLDWVARSSGTGPQDVAFMQQAIVDKARRDELMHYMGLDQNLDEATPYLKQMAASVTPQEVQAYYKAHHDAFLQIDKAKTRHIALASEEEAGKVYDALQHGGDFSALAREHSVADDHASGGELGWVPYPKGQAVPWLSQLAFAQRPGVPSRPVRSPNADGKVLWEIVLVDERQQSYLPADSDSVRFTASEALAKIKAATNFATLRAGLLTAADIRVNPRLLKADTLKL